MDTNHETITSKPEGKYNCICFKNSKNIFLYNYLHNILSISFRYSKLYKITCITFN